MAKARELDHDMKMTKATNPRTPMKADIQTDILIVGGGLVGGALACALAEGGFRVAVTDRADPAAVLDAGFDGRASAIALGSQKVLDTLGLWRLMGETVTPIEDIRVTDRGSLLFLHYDHKILGDEPFGYMVENRTLRQALVRRLPDHDGVTVLAPAKVVHLERTPAAVRARLADGREIEARLVVGADGRASQTRENAGIRLTQWSYNQTGIVCTVEHEKPHNNVAHEKFLPSGPFAILPLTGNRSSIVWTERSDIAPLIMALGEKEFLQELGCRFGDFLGGLSVTGPRWAYPLSLQYAERSIDQRLALAGDSAHGMHPIAGQGLNMGLRDVAALAQVLTDARRLGLDPGDGAVLERYQRWRRFDNTLMLALTDVLNRLFSNANRPLALARDMGLAAVNGAGPLKKVFMRHAMGQVGDLPRLMQGRPL